MDALDDLLDDENDSTPDPEPKQNNQLQAAQRKLAKLEKEAEELRAFRAEREKADRQNAVATTFQGVGLPPEWAKFYEGEDATPDAVKQWALANKFVQPVEGEEPEPAPVAPTTGFTPTVIDESTPLGMRTYSPEEFATLMREDPKKAEAAYKAGKLKKEEPEWAYSSRFYGRDT